MNLYIVYDRLLDYWAPPFLAPNDKAVLASIQPIINSGDKTNAYAQAPQQFQLWKIAEIEETTAKVTLEHKLIADLASLIRGSVRQEPDTRGTASSDSEHHPTTQVAKTTR